MKYHQEVKAGVYLRLKAPPPTTRSWREDYDEGTSGPSYTLMGTSSDETYAERDGLSSVSTGAADEVVLVKVIGVVKRTARMEK